MGRLGFHFDRRRCIGCKACQVACKDHNNLEAGVYFRNVFTCRMQESDARLSNYSGACNHCEKPECTDVCPTDAMHRMPDGTVGHAAGKCIGCGSCVWSCPYGAPVFSKKSGASQKCDSCGELRNQGKNPACVDACITHCLRFGDVDALEDKYGKADNGPFTARAPKEESASEKIEKTGFHRDSNETFLVLGGGAAGLSAASAIRERNSTGRIILLSEEACLPYSRPMLTKAPLRGFSAEHHFIYNEDWYGRQRIELKLRCRAAALHGTEKTVSLINGERLHYDKCIYALGAECFIPPISGSEKEGVVTVRRAADIEKIRRMMLKSKRAVIMGGGVIGVEIAWELKKAGMEVTLIELAKMLMERLLDEETSKLLENRLRQAGISIVTRAHITGIEETEDTGCRLGVRLENEACFPADFVILSTGIRPNINLAKESGIITGRSVIVNERMETGAACIYACGDCAEYKGVNAGTWTQAQDQGTIAGANAAGDCLVYTRPPSALLLHAAGASLFAIGDMGKKPEVNYVVRRVKSGLDSGPVMLNQRPGGSEGYETYYTENGKLVGAALLGDLSKIRQVESDICKAQEKNI